MKAMMTIAALGGLLVLGACQDQVYANDPTSAANPAASFCVNQGHSYEIRQGADGNQYGVCKFKQGGEQDAWQYFRENATGANPDLSATPDAPSGA
ncbi:putative hemolysin [Shimia marina]|uniref:Putative hemolysin n=1 Tax=Shimia marina TaxID=321267 RepID=A0A0P1ESJ9_9RHOB|nr:DUF333 domain-containing protein [Shimia marina]CUH53322.1 Putative hemolysin [Shimia marina]SFD79809.1 protein of unknown function [Shimia marina]